MSSCFSSDLLRSPILYSSSCHLGSDRLSSVPCIFSFHSTAVVLSSLRPVLLPLLVLLLVVLCVFQHVLLTACPAIHTVLAGVMFVRPATFVMTQPTAVHVSFLFPDVYKFVMTTHFMYCRVRRCRKIKPGLKLSCDLMAVAGNSSSYSS